MFYDLEFDKLNGSDKISLNDYRGKLVLIANTASRCGFAPQFAELEALWEKYKDRGLIVIGVPTNDYGNQEPLDDAGIGSFCQINFGVSFLMAKKTHAKGAEMHPFFVWVRQNFGYLAAPKWNFYKYLISKDGQPIEWFSSFRTPLSPKVIEIIEKNLPL